MRAGGVRPIREGRGDSGVWVWPGLVWVFGLGLKGGKGHTLQGS